MSIIANVRELSFMNRLLNFFPSDKPEEINVSEDGKSITVSEYFKWNADLMQRQFDVYHVTGDQYIKLDGIRSINNDGKLDIQFQVCSPRSSCQTFWMSNARVNEKIDEAIKLDKGKLTEVKHDPTQAAF